MTNKPHRGNRILAKKVRPKLKKLLNNFKLKDIKKSVKEENAITLDIATGDKIHHIKGGISYDKLTDISKENLKKY